MIKINKEYSGFTKDLKIDFSNEIWNPQTEKYNLNNLLKLYSIKEIESINKEYNKLLNYLNINIEDNINYKNLLGNKKYNSRVNDIKNKITQLKNKCNIEYIKILEERINFTNNFSNIYYNQKLIDPGKYDHISSQTGRVKLLNKEVNFLTLKKEDRNKITSTYVNGRIYVIDIVSLEPRILLHIKDKKDIYDIYEFIKKELNIEANRKSIKLGLISTIYGGATNTIKKISGLKEKEINLIHEYFDIKSFKEMITKDEDNITNYYGRPLKNGTSILNRYIQSTSADCALLAFNNLMEEWSGKRIKFCAFIHDAIIIDCHPEEFKEVENLKFIFDGILNIKLPVTVERINWKNVD